ncbi:uncharacterized protein LOC129920290 [Episyrphus balteatus]|uniref:uncharacterized protein LOC129920290 n=1 Tax=Episyrphus balteatus TaxID=286459 RepID=UPI0024855C42|nr:uncharacterized protein LOC129920290 [Episyrphus balteatus]
MRVVLALVVGLKGHNLTTDNFFTSYQLGQKLLEKQITLVGTIRKNKPELPPATVNIKGRPVLSSSFAFTRNTTIVSYIPKKNKSVNLLSTFHHDSKVSDRADKKPAIILDYNKCKGGVDTLDKAVSCYTCKRKTKRWPQVVFSNMVNITQPESSTGRKTTKRSRCQLCQKTDNKTGLVCDICNKFICKAAF